MISRHNDFGNLYIAKDNGDGTYGKPVEFNGTVSFSETVDTSDICYADNTPYMVSGPVHRTVTFDCSTDVSNSFIFQRDDADSHQTGVTCRNCGAAVKGTRCEYCGTEYPIPIKMGIYIGGHAYGETETYQSK